MPLSLVISPALSWDTLRPHLAGVPSATVAHACGVTVDAAGRWLSGKRAPHPMHLAELAALAQDHYSAGLR